MQHEEKNPTFTSIMIGFQIGITAQERVLEDTVDEEIWCFITHGLMKISTQRERKLMLECIKEGKKGKTEKRVLSLHTSLVYLHPILNTESASQKGWSSAGKGSGTRQRI